MAASRRRLLIAAVAVGAFLVSGGLDWAQNEVNIQFHSFQDTRGVTVLSPRVDLGKDFTERTGVRLKFGVDAITAASDSCARCHAEGATNSRRAIGASVVRKYGDTKWTIGGEYSQENFYRATTLLTSASKDMNKGNTTVAGGFSFSVNQPQLHPSEQTERQFAPDGFVSATQTFSKTTIVQAGYEVSRISGFQTSPFLRAKVNGVMTLGNTPDLRTRQTYTARLRQALPGDTYVEGDYRHYTDDWSIQSNALQVGVSHRFSPQLLAGFSYRYYDQTGAFFYQPQYTGNPLYYTGDFRLVPFDSGLYSWKLVVTPRDGLLGLPDGTGLTAQYDRYRTNNGFEAGMFTTGLRVPFR